MPRAGRFVWKVDTLKEFKAPNLFFGVSTSPLIEGDAVVVMVGGKEAGIVGFDRLTGKILWKTTGDPSSYASPIAVGKNDTREIITLTGSNLRGIHPAGKNSGLFLQDRLNESSTTPVKADDIVIGSSVTAGSIGLKVEKGDSAWSAKQIWKNPDLTCYFSTPVVVGKHLFMVNGAATLTNPSITLRCVELETGKVLWEKPKVARFHAAIIRTGDDNCSCSTTMVLSCYSMPIPKATRNLLVRRFAVQPGLIQPLSMEKFIFVMKRN